MSSKTNAAQAGAAVPGLTPEQYRCVLEVIAMRMATIHRLLMMLQEGDVPVAARVLLDAAELAAETVGSMADSAVDGCILGSPDRWHYGPDFVAKAEGGTA